MKILYPILLIVILCAIFNIASYFAKCEVQYRATLLPKIKYERHLVYHHHPLAKPKIIKLEVYHE